MRFVVLLSVFLVCSPAVAEGSPQGSAEACEAEKVSNICNVDQIDAADFDLKKFTSEYYLTKPLMIRNHVLDRLSKDSVLLSKEALLQRFNNVKIPIRIPEMGVYLPDETDYTTKISLSQLVEGKHEYAKRGYIFLPNKIVMEKGVTSSLLLNVFKRHSATFTKPRRAMGLGHNNTGIQFHAHFDSFFHLFWGVKEWHISKSYPPGYWGTHESLQWWLEKARPNLTDEQKNNILQCTQNDGDMLYIPEGWWHGTMNRDFSFGVAFQALKDQITKSAKDRLKGVLGDEASAEKLSQVSRQWEFKQKCNLHNVTSEEEYKRMLDDGQKVCEGLVKAMSGDVRPVHNLGAIYIAKQEITKGRKQFQKAHKMNPRDQHTKFALARAYALDPSMKKQDGLNKALILTKQLLQSNPLDSIYEQLRIEIQDLIEEHDPAQKEERIKKEWEETGHVRINIGKGDIDVPSRKLEDLDMMDSDLPEGATRRTPNKKETNQYKKTPKKKQAPRKRKKVEFESESEESTEEI